MNKTVLNALLVFVAGSSYGLIGPVIKSLAEVGIYPSEFLTLQYLIAIVLALVAMLFSWKKTRSCLKTLTLKKAAGLAIMGVFTGLTSICYYTSVSLLPSAVALTLLFQYVWMNLLIESLVERRLPTRSSVIAIIIVLIGTILATGILDGSTGAIDPMGVVFGLASALFYALFLYFSGKIGTEEPATVRLGFLTIGGFIITTICNPMGLTEAIGDTTLWPSAVLLTFLGIIIPVALINYASPKLTAGIVSVMASSEMPVGILSAWALVGDTPTTLAMIGCVLVMVAIFYKAKASSSS